MDYEKKYKETLKRARRWYDSNTNEGYRGIFENIFPELAESEDERIRKAIISYFRCSIGLGIVIDEVPVKDMVAWLEKQGEQEFVIIIPKFRIGDEIRTTNEEPLTITKIDDKGYWSKDLFICGFDDAAKWELVEQNPADKVEPKFKVGYWIVNNNSGGIYQVTEIIDNKYCLWPLDGEIMGYLGIVDVDNDYHIWTIQDAKDGDVLCLYYNNRKTFFIFKAIIGEGDYADILVHCCYTGKYQYLEPSFNGECRMHQISDGGYCLPADKEERDILFQKMKEAGYEWDAEKKELKKVSQRMISAEAKEALYDKPEWSEEDECKFSDILALLRGGENYHYNTPELFDWLKSLKERVQPKQEWSEEDEEKLLCICAWIKDYPRIADFKDEMYTVANNYINWLKSLRLQNRWKPSDEQIDVIEAVINNRSFQRRYLDSLYKQLKKLREE